MSSSLEGPFAPGRPEAAAAVWRWRPADDPSQATERQAQARKIRIRGAIQAAVGAGVGSLAYVYGATGLAWFIFSVAGLILLASQLSPAGLFGAIEQLFRTLGRWLGRGLTWLLLTPLFYLFFLPFGLLLRRGRRDRLQRYFDEQVSSYWQDLSGPTAPSASLERQY